MAIADKTSYQTGLIEAEFHIPDPLPLQSLHHNTDILVGGRLKDFNSE